MKKIIFSVAILLVVSGAIAQSPGHLDPGVAGIGKELPRGDVVSHASREAAIRNLYHDSEYLQRLTDWTRTETDEAVSFRARYKIPFAWLDREQFLHLERVSGSFDVIINGKRTAYSQAGSVPVEFDITDASREGNNELEIVVYKQTAGQKLENSRPVASPAIEGEAYVLSQPQVRVRDIAIDTRMEGTDGLLGLGVIMKSHRLNPRDYTVYYELLSPRGEILTEGHRDVRIDMAREDTVRFFANIRDIVPWSHEEPRLYTLVVKTQNDGRFREYVSFRVGFRSVSFVDGSGTSEAYGVSGGRLLLNGTPLNLAMHNFVPETVNPDGKLDIEAERGRIEQLRTEGVNTLRLCGAPPSREFYALCDEMGVYLVGQADIDTHLSGTSRRVGGNPSNDPAWEAAYLDRVTAMYHTSKNSPSMVAFSIAQNSANGYNLYESYLALKALETHRPILYTDGGEWNSDRLETGSAATEISGAAAEITAIGVTGDVSAAADASSRRFEIRNTRSFTPIIGEALYSVVVGRRTVSHGSVKLRIPAGGSQELTVPIEGVKKGKDFVVRIEVVTERSPGRFVPGEEFKDRRIFRDRDASTADLPEEERVVPARGEFSSTDPAPAK